MNPLGLKSFLDKVDITIIKQFFLRFDVKYESLDSNDTPYEHFLNILEPMRSYYDLNFDLKNDGNFFFIWLNLIILKV